MILPREETQELRELVGKTVHRGHNHDHNYHKVLHAGIMMLGEDEDWFDAITFESSCGTVFTRDWESFKSHGYTVVETTPKRGVGHANDCPCNLCN